MKSLLREYIKAVLCEESGPPSWAKWFHISSKDLGDEFTFTPRIPGAPYEDSDGNVIEDDITKRTSWAPSIDKAKEALEFVPQNGYVYAVSDLPGEVDLPIEFEEKSEELDSPGNEYGETWEMNKFMDYVGRVTGKIPSKAKVRHELEAMVPDAPRTGEHWATKPVVAKKVAELGREPLKTRTTIATQRGSKIVWL